MRNRQSEVTPTASYGEHSGETMKTQHTPEPWHVPLNIDKRHQRVPIMSESGANRPDKSGHIEPGAVLVASVQTAHVTWPTAEANAARAVACVNACEGINPAAVPDMLRALQDRLSRFLELGDPFSGDDWQEVQDLREVIAKATS